MVERYTGGVVLIGGMDVNNLGRPELYYLASELHQGSIF
jgi:hypothetical protein